MGPAGFTLAHHLMNDGHTVVGIDGLKIEPLDATFSGVEPNGKRVAFHPVRDVEQLREPLEHRVMAGFGGVAGVRHHRALGQELPQDRAPAGGAAPRSSRCSAACASAARSPLEDAFALGFDHIALAIGAGKPTVLDMPNGLARGVRTASDFLMALQLTGAAKPDSIANMQVRLPIVVIGGGLTAIDTATESLAYYAVQVEKFLARYETAGCRAQSGERCATSWDDQEREIGEEYLAHARTIRDERARARAEGASRASSSCCSRGAA